MNRFYQKSNRQQQKLNILNYQQFPLNQIHYKKGHSIFAGSKFANKKNWNQHSNKINYKLIDLFEAHNNNTIKLNANLNGQIDVVIIPKSTIKIGTNSSSKQKILNKNMFNINKLGQNFMNKQNISQNKYNKNRAKAISTLQLPIFSKQNSQQFNYNNYQQQNQQYVFDPKNYLSLRNRQHNIFNQTFKNYQRSTSRSNSKNKIINNFTQIPKVKSQIKIPSLNSFNHRQNQNNSLLIQNKNNFNQQSQNSLINKLNNNKNILSIRSNRSNRSNQFDYVEQDSSKNYNSRKLININQNNKKRPSQFSFQQQNKIAFNNHNKIYINQNQGQPYYIQNNINDIHDNNCQINNTDNSKYQHKNNYQISNLPSSILQKTQLHTIQQVQQSIKSIQLPQPSNIIDPDISRRINQHFQQIKQNMLRQLLMRSKQGKNIDNLSMNHIVQQIQQATDNIMNKYCQQPLTVNLIKNQSKNQIQFSITESKKFNNQFNKKQIIPAASIMQPLKQDICGSDQNNIQQILVNHNITKNNQTNLIRNINNQNYKQAKNQLIVKNQMQPLESFATVKQVNLQKNQKHLKYGQTSKEQSSISSINQEDSIKIHQFNSIKNDIKQNIPEKNKDSMNAQLQSINRYTFMKRPSPPSIYTYANQKQLDQKSYKIQQKQSNQGTKVYTVRYDVKYLQKTPERQRKPLQVFRLSPFKFKKRQDVVKDMVKNKFINKQSESIVLQKQ